MTEAQMFAEELVWLDRSLGSKDAVLEFLADGFAGAGRTGDRAALLAALHAREDEISTAVGFGFAIPHAKSEAVATPSVGFLRLTESITWSPEDDARFLVSIIVPQQGADVHLKLIAQLARKLIDEDFRTQLEKAGSAREVVDLLNNS